MEKPDNFVSGVQKSVSAQDVNTETENGTLTRSQELEFTVQGLEAILRGLVTSIQGTQADTPARAIVMNTFGRTQQEYFQTKSLMLCTKVLEHFNGDLQQTFQSLDNAVTRILSPIVLVSADGMSREKKL